MKKDFHIGKLRFCFLKVNKPLPMTDNSLITKFAIELGYGYHEVCSLILGNCGFFVLFKK